MSGVGAAATPSGILAHLALDSDAISVQLDAALQQLSTGKVSSGYSGLGSGVRTSLDLRPAIQHARVWQANIDQASSRLEVTQSALGQISSIAATFYASTSDITPVGTSEVTGIAAAAKLALEQVAQLLNTRSGDVYVFAGQDTGNPPVPNTNPGVIGAELLASDTGAPFSTTIGSSVPHVEVGEGQFVQTGLLANANTLATSAEPTTGSYTRDVMRALATLANMTDGPGAQAVAADTRARLHSAVGALADETGALGDIQAILVTRKAALAATQTTMDNQVSNVEDVDIAATVIRVSALQTQLQASYRVIAATKSLSLASYL